MIVNGNLSKTSYVVIDPKTDRYLATSVKCSFKSCHRSGLFGGGVCATKLDCNDIENHTEDKIWHNDNSNYHACEKFPLILAVS